jgi:hypothetical protein
MLPQDLLPPEMHPTTTVVSVEATRSENFDSMALEIASEMSTDVFTYENIAIKFDLTKISKEVYEKVLESVKTLARVYHIFGMDRPSKGCMGNFVHRSTKIRDEPYYHAINMTILRCLTYLLRKGQDKWVDYFKHVTLNFYSFYETENTDLIPRLDGLEPDHHFGVLFPGVFNRFVFFLQKKEQKKFSEFILTINQAKMGLPRPTEDLVKKKEFETAEFLTSEPRPLPSEELITHISRKGRVCGTMLNKELICKELRRTVREAFKGAIYTEKMHYEPFCPSTNANYNYSRSAGGAVGAIRESIIEGYQLAADDLLPIKTIEVEAERGYLIESATFRGKDDDHLFNALRIPDEGTITALGYDDTLLRQKWRELMDVIHDHAVGEEPLVVPVGLSEALKVRVISKGPPILYTYLKPFQKFMHSHLRKQRVFRLIGEPASEAIINELFDAKTADPDVMILNGDYKASTDNLRGWVSETLADELCDLLDETGSFKIDRELLKRSLTGHIFVMKNGEKRAQKDGQLMGSISSFPFLCLANAALCRLALEWSHGCKFPLWKVPLLVNGDDCTMFGPRIVLRRFPINVTIRDIWEKITNFAGLTSSQGKTLFSLPHKPIVVINSMTFDWDPVSLRFIERKYVPLGIMLNKPRSGISGESQARNYQALGALHHQLLRMCPTDVWDIVSKEFIDSVRSILDVCPNIPWYTPTHLGGPGLVPTFSKSGKPKVSEHDRKLFSFMIGNRDEIKSRPEVARREHEWSFHNHVMDSYKSVGIRRTEFLRTNFQEENVKLDEEAQTYYRLRVVETLFSKKLEKLYTKKTSDIVDKEVEGFARSERLNSRFHTRAQDALKKSSSKIKLLSWEEICDCKDISEFPVIGSCSFDYDEELAFRASLVDEVSDAGSD